jgi:hypothetical protein
VRSSKKRKLAGVELRGITIKLPKPTYEKLSQLAGLESLASTVERMTEHYFDRAVRKHMQSQQVNGKSLCS